MRWDEGWGPINDWFNRGAVLKYEIATQTWTDVSPQNFIDPGDNSSNPNYYDTDTVYAAGYSGISINPKNPLEMVTSTMGYFGAQFWYIDSTGKWKDSWGSNFYYTNDGGKSWVPSFQYYWLDGGITPTAKQMSANGINWTAGHAIHWAGSVVIDPFNPKRVFSTSGNGIYMTDDITAFTYDSSKYPILRQTTAWKVVSHGVEEVVPLGLVSIPGGPVISVIGDYDGFRHDDVTKYPEHSHLTNVNDYKMTLGTTRAVAWAPKAGILVKLTDAHSANPTTYTDVPISPLQFSADTGKSWSVKTYEAYPEQYKRGDCVAISTDGAVALWVPSHKTESSGEVAGAYPALRYANSAWTEVAGINGAYIVGDPVNANVFYAYQKTEGTFYKSSDKGVTFTKAGTPGPGTSWKFQLVPGKEGDIWIALGKGGLIRSVDGGTAFSAVSGATFCDAIGFGKAAPEKTFPAVYLSGTVAGVTGIFQSIDEGATWVRINDDAHMYGGLANGEFVVGDMNTFGVVYRSTAGRGIACRLPASMVSKKTPHLPRKAYATPSWKLARGVLQLQQRESEVQSVSLYSLAGKRLFHQTYTGPATIALQRLCPAQTMGILEITGKEARTYRSLVNLVR